MCRESHDRALEPRRKRTRYIQAGFDDVWILENVAQNVRERWDNVEVRLAHGQPDVPAAADT
jgi:hypothetical protein